MTLTDSELIFRLLSMAFIELRDRGRESRDKVVFHIADVLHNAPSGLMLAGNDPERCRELLTSLRERAERSGCARWLETRIDEIVRNHEAHESSPGE